MQPISFRKRSAAVLVLVMAIRATCHTLSNEFKLRSLTPCAAALCPENTECIARHGEAHCVPLGGEKCGSTVCGKGLTCCNASCGTCVPPGKGCTKQFCLPATGETCGAKKCPEDEICCNASCGICTPPDAKCPQIFCS